MKKTEKDRLLYRRLNTRARHLRCYVPGKDAKNDRNTKGGIGRSMHGGDHSIDFTPLYRFLLGSVGKEWAPVYSEAINRLGDHRDAIWHIVIEDHTRHRMRYGNSMWAGIARIGDNSMYSKLTVDEDGILRVYDPTIKNEMIEPSCACCTHTFNGKPLVKKFNAERAGFGKNYVAPPAPEPIGEGSMVSKISGKPFKSGLKAERVVSISVNQQDPRKRTCAVFADGSVCNMELLIPYQ